MMVKKQKGRGAIKAADLPDLGGRSKTAA